MFVQWLKKENAPDASKAAGRFYWPENGVMLFAVMITHLEQFNICFRDAVNKAIC